MYRYSIYLLLIFTFIAYTVNGQEEDPAEDEETLLTIDTPITIDLETEEDKAKVAPKKKKRKKNVFYGRKTKKGFTRTGYGDNLVIELFHYLKHPVELDPYAREIYWYDFRRKSIRKSRKVDEDYGVILHGPYSKIKGDKIIEKGIYYEGLKHGRWTKSTENDVLMDKKRYFKGWPKESLVRYYDKDRTKMKEIIPVQFGVTEGDYFYFHPNGNVAVSGEFSNGKRVGQWIEYYPLRGRRKKIVQYPKDPYSGERPYILKEWNNRGKLVYDYVEFMKQVGAQGS